MSDKDKSGDAGNQGSVKVGDKVYSAEDVQGLLAQSAKATQALQTVAEVNRLADQFGLGIPELLQQVPGAFNAIGSLIDKGVLTETGELNQEFGRQKSKQRHQDADDLDDPLMKLFQQDGRSDDRQDQQGGGGRMKALAQGLQQYEERLSQIEKTFGTKLGELEKDNAALIRQNLVFKLEKKIPGFREEDANLVIGRAQNDRTKSVFEHAQAIVQERANQRETMRMELAKELGIEDLPGHMNKLKQQESGGGAAAMAEGKKFTFRPAKDDPNAVSPLEATKEFFDKSF